MIKVIFMSFTHNQITELKRELATIYNTYDVLNVMHSSIEDETHITYYYTIIYKVK